MLSARIQSISLSIIGVVLVVAGIAGVLVGILAMVDPIGTKMADDGDPFGVPPSFLGSLLTTVVCAAVAAGGFWCLRGKGKQHDI